MAAESASPNYSKSFRRALQRVITKQLNEGRVSPKSGAAKELFTRGDPDDIVAALLETIAVLATDDGDRSDPDDRIEHAVANLGRRKVPTAKP